MQASDEPELTDDTPEAPGAEGLSCPACGALVAIWGFAFILSQPAVGLWWLALISPVPLIWMAIAARSLRVALAAVAIVAPFIWGWAHRWIIDVTLAGFPLLALYMTAWTCLLVWCIRRLVTKNAWPMFIVAPLVWVGVEFLRGALFLGGYAWFLQAHPLIDWPAFAQSADIIGTYGLTALVVIGAGVVIDLIRTRSRRAISGGVLAAVILIANILYGAYRLGQTDAITPGPRVLLVQTNLEQDRKQAWTLAEKENDVARWNQMTRDAVAAAGDIDLIAWPETMLGVHGLEFETIQTLHMWQPAEAKLAMSALRLQRDLDIPTIYGSPAFENLREQDQAWAWSSQYNSAYLVQDEPALQRYDKYFLTPFGEVMPVISRWNWLEDRLAALGAHGMTFELDAADEPRMLLWNAKNEGQLGIGTPICFEVTVSSVCRRMMYADGEKRGAVLINLTNDAWFFGFDEGRMLHERNARLRCIENRVPLVRAANTGFSLGIDSTGKLIAPADGGRYPEARTAGTVVVELPLDRRRTLYGRIGDAVGWLALGLLVLGMMPSPRRTAGKAE